MKTWRRAPGSNAWVQFGDPAVRLSTITSYWEYTHGDRLRQLTFVWGQMGREARIEVGIRERDDSGHEGRDAPRPEARAGRKPRTATHAECPLRGPRVTALWCRYRARVHPGSDVRAVERALAAYYEQEASDRAKRPIDPQRVEARTRFITRLDGRRPRILEVGVGPGRDAASFVAEGIPVVGVDLSVEHALRASSTGVHAVVGTVRRLPFGNSAFAALWTMSTLMHVPNAAIADALVELRRVLAPGALAAVGVWGGPDVEHRRGIDDFDPPRFFSLRSDERWRSLLSTLGSVEDFEIWGRRDDYFWYQWAVVRTA